MNLIFLCTLIIFLPDGTACFSLFLRVNRMVKLLPVVNSDFPTSFKHSVAVCQPIFFELTCQSSS